MRRTQHSSSERLSHAIGNHQQCAECVKCNINQRTTYEHYYQDLLCFKLHNGQYSRGSRNTAKGVGVEKEDGIWLIIVGVPRLLNDTTAAMLCPYNRGKSVSLRPQRKRSKYRGLA